MRPRTDARITRSSYNLAIHRDCTQNPLSEKVGIGMSEPVNEFDGSIVEEKKRRSGQPGLISPTSASGIPMCL